MNKKLFALLIATIPLSVNAFDARTDMKPYPPPEPGYQRVAFNVPARENETDFAVEIIAGKTMMVDCNEVVLGGKLEKHIAKGWGFPFYVIRASKHAASTLMACPPGAEKKEIFVRMSGENFIQRYNSRLPVVVYAPNEYQVRHRVWSAGEESGAAEQK